MINLYSLPPRERIEEAHGLWELAAARALALAEAVVATDGKPSVHELMAEALVAEREAYTHWKVVSDEALDERSIAHLEGGGSRG